MGIISKDLFWRVVRFGVVGTSGFLIDFSVTALLYELLGFSIVLATGIGFCFGATSNYILNRRWTWKSTNPDVRGEYIKFLAVSLMGLGIHYLVLLASMEWLNVSFSMFGLEVNNDWCSKLIATAVVMVWNFLVNNFYTFRKR